MAYDYEQRSRAETSLIQISWSDADRREGILADPTRAFAEALAEVGGSLPEGTEVRILEESTRSIFFVIPHIAPTGDSPALDERSSRAEIEAAILVEAQRDPEARAALVADPRAAYLCRLPSLREGAQLPESLGVEAVEESEGVLYLRLPARSAERAGELTTEELEAAVGGVAIHPFSAVAAVTLGAAVTATLGWGSDPETLP